MSEAGTQRLDKWLWCARVLKARTSCAALVEAGLVRINRLPTDKPHARVRPGDVLTVPMRGDVAVLRVLSLAERRGTPAQAAVLYELLLDGLPPRENDCISGQPSAQGPAPRGSDR
jgi:ribosome-associated heat shock protein Hsp15